MIADHLLERLQGVRQRGPDRWVAVCPAHQDRDPSLSIRDQGDRVLVHCFAGCSPLAIVEAIGLELKNLFAPTADFKPQPRRTPPEELLHARFLIALGRASLEQGQALAAADQVKMMAALDLVRRAGRHG